MTIGIICGVIICFIGASFFVYKRDGHFGYACLTKDQPFSRWSYGTTESSHYESRDTIDEATLKFTKSMKN